MSDAPIDPSADEPVPPAADEPESRPGGLPLYVWVLGAVALAIPCGLALGGDAGSAVLPAGPGWPSAPLSALATACDLAPQLIIRGPRAPRPRCSSSGDPRRDRHQAMLRSAGRARMMVLLPD